MEKLIYMLFLSVPAGVSLILIPFVIIRCIFDISLNANNFIFFTSIYGMIYMYFIFNSYSEKGREEYEHKMNKITVIMVILAFPLLYCFGGIERKNLSSTKISSEYYRNYSNSNYKNSDSSSYTPPIEKKSSDENKISVTPSKISEEQKNLDDIEIENNIPQITEYKKENFEPKTESENPVQKSSSYQNYFEDKWEFVTDDEFGNKYYINKNYSVSIFDSPLEGKIFSVEFKKVLKNGYYVDVPALDKNYKMTTEKKYLSHEEYIVHFRNENGFKEFKISVITGYDENDSVIIGYGSTQMKDFMKWKSVNNTLYNELYEAAYSRLK